MSYKTVTNCRVCGSLNLARYLSLPDSPLCNALQEPDSEAAENFPLSVLFCRDCCLSQLSIVVDPKILYKDYCYHSSISKTFQQHCYDLGKKLKAMWVCSPKPPWFFGTEKKWAEKRVPRVMDIASNDGCLLREFKKLGFTGVGIEPSENMNKFNPESDITQWVPTITAFWSEEFARDSMNYNRIRPWGDYPSDRMDFITALNVFAHVDDLSDFLKGVKIALEDKGIFVVEVPYLSDLIKGNQFDTIYHEHLSYFLLLPLLRLFNQHKLPIFKVEHIDIHGGSLRLYASHNFYPQEDSVADILEQEMKDGFHQFGTYADFAAKVYSVGEKTQEILDYIEKSGSTIMAYGAAAKGISFLNYIHLTTKDIIGIIDDTPAKQNKMAPGCNIPILDNSFLEKVQPDYLLILPWNFQKEIFKRTKSHSDRGGKYIVAIPEVRVL